MRSYIVYTALESDVIVLFCYSTTLGHVLKCLCVCVCVCVYIYIYIYIVGLICISTKIRKIKVINSRCVLFKCCVKTRSNTTHIQVFQVTIFAL
jgi:hypothetical protein